MAGQVIGYILPNSELVSIKFTCMAEKKIYKVECTCTSQKPFTTRYI